MTVAPVAVGRARSCRRRGRAARAGSRSSPRRHGPRRSPLAAPTGNVDPRRRRPPPQTVPRRPLAAGETTAAYRRHADDHRPTARHAAERAPSTALDRRRPARSRSRSGTAMNGGPREPSLAELTDEYNASQTKVHVNLADPGRLRADDRPSTCIERARATARPRADARVHGAADGRHQARRAGRGVHPRPTATTRRRSCPGAAGVLRPRACSGRCRSTSATRCCSTTRRSSRPPASTRTSHR